LLFLEIFRSQRSSAFKRTVKDGNTAIGSYQSTAHLALFVRMTNAVNVLKRGMTNVDRKFLSAA
jgi:hypothetical protein